MAHNALPICDPPSGCRRPGRRRQVRAKAARPEQQELLLCGVLVVSIGVIQSHQPLTVVSESAL